VVVVIVVAAPELLTSIPECGGGIIIIVRAIVSWAARTIVEVCMGLDTGSVVVGPALIVSFGTPAAEGVTSLEGTSAGSMSTKKLDVSSDVMFRVMLVGLDERGTNGWMNEGTNG
jgi:hypothetical protein